MALDCCQHVLTQRQVLDFLSPLADKLPDKEKESCRAAITNLTDPLHCWHNFLQPSSQDGDAVLCEDDPEPLDASTSALDTLKSGFNKATGSLLDLILDLMRGNYLPGLIELSGASEKLSKLIAQDMKAGKSCDGEAEVGKDLKKLLQHIILVVQGFDTNTKSVSLAETLPAPSLLQTLGRDTAKDEEVEARNHVWKQVQAERKKYVSFSCPKNYQKDTLMNAFKASGKVFAFNGQLNSQHRLVCAAADLLEESGEEPWLISTVPKDDTWKSTCEFISGLTGPTDFGIAFDGRMRSVRRINVARMN